MVIMISAGIIVLNTNNPFDFQDEASEIQFPTPIATEIEEILEATETEMVEEESYSTGNVDQPDERPLPAPINTLELLENTDVPLNDWVELAERLGGVENIPLIAATNPTAHELGAHHITLHD